MKNGSKSWSPSLKQKGDALLKDIEGIPSEEFITALDQVAFDRLSDFQRGVKAYHEHPYVRDLDEPQTVWSEGNSRLLDYGGPENGPVLICVPSLINRAYVLDLSARRSFVRSMADKGIRTYLLDWGPLGTDERPFTIDDYIAGRLTKAFDFLQKIHAQKIHMLGYCMGGVMATAFAALHPNKLASLSLLATPWDFHAGEANHKNIIASQRIPLELGIKMLGVLSVDVLQGLFSAIDPFGVIQKFQKFADMKSNSAKAEHFVAMEDWLNDGVPLAGEVAKTCLFDWYVENKPALGQWNIEGKTVDATKISCPTIVYIAERDRIVLPASTKVLSNYIPHANIKSIDSGHVSMVCGQKAVGSLYTPISKWLLTHGM